MIEQHIDISSTDGNMNCFVVYPEEGGPFPVVLFYMDAPGKREELHDMARRIAAVGYYVVLPNLYYRSKREFEVKERTEAALAEMFKLMGSLNANTAMVDTTAMLRFVDTQAQADSQRVGCVGYCMSGPFVVWAGAAFPDRLRCIASIHGANMVTDKADSPHRMVANISGECYFACAQTDVWAPPEHIEKLQTALQEAGTRYRIEWYPETEHGFVFPSRTIYNKAASERHWERLFALFARTLN